MKTTIPVLGVLAVLMAVKTTYAAVAAGPIVNPTNGHSYYVLTQNNWTASEAEAITLGGHLTTIDDAIENAWVLNTLSPLADPLGAMWIGLNDVSQEGTFVWANGSSSAYRNWRPGEPSNSLGIEDYVLMYSSGQGPGTAGFWNDYSNSNEVNLHPINGVVEIVPEPATLYLTLVSTALLGVACRRKHNRKQN